MKIQIDDFIKAIDAVCGHMPYGCPQYVDQPLIDSRSYLGEHNAVFFALRTTSDDGHRYINELYKKGLRVFVVDNDAELPELNDALYLRVNDVKQALVKSAEYIRSHLDIPVIAITGSRAKTVVKEKLASLLADKISFARSPRSYNSQIGVPLSMWQADSDSQALIIEAGVSEPGEMETLRQIIKPSIGIFTCITGEHARAFKSADEKCREKAQLFINCRRIIYPGTDAMIGNVLAETCPNASLIAASDYDDMAVKAAELLGINAPASPTHEVSARIDFVDTVDGYTIAYDNFTCDKSGIATGLDAVRRRLGVGEKLWIVTDPATAQNTDVAAVIAKHGLGGNVLTGTGEDIADKISQNQFYGSTVYINGCDKRAFGRLFSNLCGRGHITRLEVNLDNLESNLRHYQSQVPADTGLIGMIKASAYGCGDVEVARSLQSRGVAMVAVAVADEGVALRRAGITIPILVLDPWCENMRSIFAYNLEPTVIDANPNTLRRLDEAAAAEGVTSFAVHLKIDTGMHRVGLSTDDIEPFCAMLRQHPNIRIASIFSHLATADCLDMDDYTNSQLDAFRHMTDKIISLIGYPVKRHVLNTAGITRFGRDHVYEMARLGIGLYGISPLPDDATPLQPVARLVTSIIRTHDYAPGDTIGYGRCGKIKRPSRIATLPIGYADGIDRRLGNGNASFYVNGTLCPTVGNICMDLCMIDITDCHDIGNGSVEIFGDHIPMQRLAETLGTIPYEILTSISPRVKRIYFRE